jgi:proteasome accessory factor C
MVPWIVERGGGDIDEIAARFGIPAGTVLRELSTAQCYEIPPYGPDNTLGIVVIDGRVEVEPGALLDKPLRLGPQEGFGLLAAGRAALAALGDDEGVLASALGKLETALGDRVPLEVELARPQVTDELEAAIGSRQRVEIDYYGAARDEVTTRRIDPVNIVHHSGDWFVHAWCHRAGAARTFRIDRIEALRPTGETFEPIDLPGEVNDIGPAHDAPDVVVRLPADARWAAESYPVRHVEELPDGRLDVTFGLQSDVFLDRLLLRVGPDAEVLAPPELRDAGRRAAARVLAGYGIVV